MKLKNYNSRSYERSSLPSSINDENLIIENLDFYYVAQISFWCIKCIVLSQPTDNELFRFKWVFTFLVRGSFSLNRSGTTQRLQVSVLSVNQSHFTMNEWHDDHQVAENFFIALFRQVKLRSNNLIASSRQVWWETSHHIVHCFVTELLSSSLIVALPYRMIFHIMGFTSFQRF